MHKLLKTTAVAVAIALPFAGPAFAQTVEITFVQTNDIDQFDGDGDRGGFARLATVINEARAEGHAFLVHSGDTISPSLLSGIDQGAHIFDFLNRLEVDAMVPGNHEFDFGPEILQERLAEAEFPVVSSNVFEADGSPLAGTVEDIWIEVDGINIAIYGLTTTSTPVVSSPGDLTFADEVETALAKAEELRADGADLVVAVTHTGREVDFEIARTGAADLLFTGHDEFLMAYFNGRTVVTESNAQANWVVVTTVTVVKDEEGEVEFTPVFELIDTANVDPDPAIQAVVDEYNAQLDAELNVVIGTTETALDSRRASVRSLETAIGNLITDAMRAAVGADVGITNGGGIRADRTYDAGTELTRRDILSELPFGNSTVMVELTGAQVIAALENGFSAVSEGAGRFPQVSGLTVEVDLDAPVGERVQSVMVGGEPIDPDAMYTVATNDFMANGGDGYTVLGDGESLVPAADATLMASQVIDYIEAAGTVSPEVEGRIVFQ